MEVLKTTSPTVWPGAPIEIPRNTVPSASTNMAGVCCGTFNPLFLKNYRFEESGCAKREECLLFPLI
jgi:hypothetical protein